VEIVVVRPFNHIGPGQSEGFLVPTIAAQVGAIARGASELRITLAGPDAVRDFSDVRDVVRAYRLLVTSGKSGEVYNVASGSGTSVTQLAALMCELAGTRARIDLAESEPTEQPPSLLGDSGKLRALGWAPEKTLRQTIADVLAEYLPGRESVGDLG
jgi:GDP-4-dehydro-6-deoxy-D-mannose reductase